MEEMSVEKRLLLAMVLCVAAIISVDWLFPARQPHCCRSPCPKHLTQHPSNLPPAESVSLLAARATAVFASIPGLGFDNSTSSSTLNKYRHLNSPPIAPLLRFLPPVLSVDPVKATESAKVGDSPHRWGISLTVRSATTCIFRKLICQSNGRTNASVGKAVRRKTSRPASGTTSSSVSGSTLGIEGIQDYTAGQLAVANSRSGAEPLCPWLLSGQGPEPGPGSLALGHRIRSWHFAVRRRA